MRLYSLPLIALLTSLASAQSPVIKQVTVLPDRAIVSKVMQVQLQPGEQSIQFNGLPLSLEDISVRAAISDTETPLEGVAIIKDVQVTPLWKKSENARVEDIAKQLEKLTQDLKYIQDDLSVVKEERELLSAISKSATTPAKEQKVVMSDWQQLATYYKECTQALLVRRQGLEEKERSTLTQIAMLKQQLGVVQPTSGPISKQVSVRIKSLKSVPASITINYMVPNASWLPRYVARYSSATSKVGITLRAQVTNNTVEDWENVRLVLSTARPHMGNVPTAQPWVLSEARPQVHANAGGAFLFSDSATVSKAAAAPMSREMVMEPVQVQKNLTSVTYSLPDTYSLNSSKNHQLLDVTELEMDSTIRHEAVPKLQPAAFLIAILTNKTEFELLQGNVDVFVDNTFLSSSRLPSVAPGQEFPLSLGVDNNVAVKHKLVRRYEEETGLTNSGKRIILEFLISIHNQGSTKAVIHWKEAVPSSQNEKITVKVDGDLKDATKTPEGFLQFKTELTPNGKREFRFKYTIEYPKNFPIDGL